MKPETVVEDEARLSQGDPAAPISANGRPIGGLVNDHPVEDALSPDDPPAEDYASYRAISPVAVGSLVVGLASFSAFINWWLVAVPIAGVLLGVFAWRQIGTRRDELTGRPMALAGILLSAACGIGGQASLWHEYLTEVPEGYARLTYDDLQPDERVPSQIVPPSIHEQDGERIFIKGYVLAGTRREGITTFILVRDQGDCCFGGNPKLTDRILVQLKPGRVFSYTDRRQKIIGEFHVREGKAVDVAGDVVYQLRDAEIL